MCRGLMGRLPSLRHLITGGEKSKQAHSVREREFSCGFSIDQFLHPLQQSMLPKSNAIPWS